MGSPVVLVQIEPDHWQVLDHSIRDFFPFHFAALNLNSFLISISLTTFVVNTDITLLLLAFIAGRFDLDYPARAQLGALLVSGTLFGLVAT